MAKDIEPLSKDNMISSPSSSPNDTTSIAQNSEDTPKDTKPYAPKKHTTPAPPTLKTRNSAPRLPHTTSQDASNKQLDGRTAQRLRKGKIPIEDSIDLHGMNQAEAHAALHHFIRRATALKYRCVLVITGKGSRSHSKDAPRGILKKRFPDWLAQEPLHSLVLKYEPARQQHGGGGAFYIYLRREKTR